MDGEMPQPTTVQPMYSTRLLLHSGTCIAVSAASCSDLHLHLHSCTRACTRTHTHTHTHVLAHVHARPPMRAHTHAYPRTVLRMRATPRNTWSRAPSTVMVRSGSLGVSSDRDCTRTVAPESLMMSRTVWPTHAHPCAGRSRVLGQLASGQAGHSMHGAPMGAQADPLAGPGICMLFFQSPTRTPGPPSGCLAPGMLQMRVSLPGPLAG